MFQRCSDFCNMQMRCFMVSSTQHRPNKLPQMTNISSNNCAHCNVSLEVSVHSTYYFRRYSTFRFSTEISGVDDVIIISFPFLKTKIFLERDEKLIKQEGYSSLFSINKIKIGINDFLHLTAPLKGPHCGSQK